MSISLHDKKVRKFRLVDDWPLYLQVKQYIEWQIYYGKLAAGQKIPGSRNLAAELTVNSHIVQRVLTELLHEQILVNKADDYFVTDNNERISELKQDLLNNAVKDFIGGLNKQGVDNNQINSAFRRILKLGV